MESTKLFQSSAQVIEWLRKIAKPMIDSEGKRLPNTGYIRVTISKGVIDTLLYGGAQARDTGKDTVYNFVRDGKRYTLKVAITHAENKNCVFIWDHRDGNLAEPEPEAQFEISLRMVSNRTFVKVGTWTEVNRFKHMPSVTAWEINRRVAGQPQMVAQSHNYHSISAAQAMRRSGQAAPEQQVIDGLLVDIQYERTYIYFRAAIDPFDSCIKIYNGTHLSIEGGVTLDNYEGFMKAAALAKTYLRPLQ